MARIARVIVPGEPHHITQRGNRRQHTFFGDADYTAYIDLLSASCAEFSVQIWAWCLMPNHLHLIAVPASAESLREAIGRAHQRYTNRINQREGWRGHLWQGRFSSFVLDEGHLWTAGRYVELNPVRAGLVAHPADWPWSSARGHLGLDGGHRLADPLALSQRFGDWADYLSAALTLEELETFRRHGRTGRPLGNEGFLTQLEMLLSRPLRRRKPGPQRRSTPEENPGQMELWDTN